MEKFWPGLTFFGWAMSNKSSPSLLRHCKLLRSNEGQLMSSLNNSFSTCSFSHASVTTMGLTHMYPSFSPNSPCNVKVWRLLMWRVTGRTQNGYSFFVGSCLRGRVASRSVLCLPFCGFFRLGVSTLFQLYRNCTLHNPYHWAPLSNDLTLSHSVQCWSLWWKPMLGCTKMGWL